MSLFSRNEPPAASGYRDADLDHGMEASILARALERVALVAGSPVSADEALRATLASARGGRDPTSVALAAARALGLRPARLQVAPRRSTQPQPGLLSVGPGLWLVAHGTRGRRQRVTRFDARGASQMAMSHPQLRAASGGRDWLQMQPALALDPIRTPGQDPSERPWRRLRSFLGLEHRELWVVLIYALVIGALTLAAPITVQALVNTVAFGTVLQPLVVLTLLLFGGLMFSGLLSVLEAYVVEVLQRRVFVRVADDFGRRFPSVRTEALDASYGPELANRFFEVVAIQKSLAGLLLDGLALALQTAIGMVLLGFYHPLLLTFDVVLVTLLVLVLLAGRGAVATGLAESSAKYKMVAWLEDVSRNVHLFRGESARDHATMRTETLCRDYLTARKSHFQILIRQITGGVGLQIIATVALLGVGGWLVINRQLTLGQLVAAELVIAAMGAGFMKLGKNLEKLYDLNVGVLKLTRVVDLPMERTGGDPLFDDGPMSIALRGLTVARGTTSLFSTAEIEIEAGERVAIRGDSGSGKSTLLDIVAGLRTPGAGCVHLAGVDLRRINLASARDRVGLARGADFVVGSVIDNVRISSGGTLEERKIRELLRLFDLERVIDALPSGLDTPMFPAGNPLSETQARRLALVRTLASRPRLLLLDRALDGLGLAPDQQAAALDFIFGRGAPWTTLVVSENPEVVARCDRSLLIHEGTLEIEQ